MDRTALIRNAYCHIEQLIRQRSIHGLKQILEDLVTGIEKLDDSVNIVRSEAPTLHKKTVPSNTWVVYHDWEDRPQILALYNDEGLDMRPPSILIQADGHYIFDFKSPTKGVVILCGERRVTGSDQRIFQID